MGAVYRATDQVLQRTVAIKILTSTTVIITFPSLAPFSYVTPFSRSK